MQETSGEHKAFVQCSNQEVVSLSLSDKSNSSNASSRVCFTWLMKSCCFSNEYLIEFCRIETGKPVNDSVTMNILWASVSETLLSILISASSIGS